MTSPDYPAEIRFFATMSITNAYRPAVSSEGEDKEFTDHLERELAQHFALAALQVLAPISTLSFPQFCSRVESAAIQE